MNVDDRNFLLDILNYDMKPIFTSLGFNVEGGDFVYAHKDKVDTQEMLNVVKGMKEMGLPMDDDWLYETFGIEKPKDYDKQKESIEAQKQAIRESLQRAGEDPHREEPLNTDKKPFKDRLKSFFGVAPAIGADTDF